MEFWLSSSVLAAMSSSRSDFVTLFVCPSITKKFFFSCGNASDISPSYKGFGNDVCLFLNQVI